MNARFVNQTLDSRSVMRSDVYVYVLLDGRNPGPAYFGHWKFSHEPFYVGKGTGQRVKHHAWAAVNNYGPNKHKLNKIRKIQKSGDEVVVRFVKVGLSNAEANYYEQRLIRIIGRSDLGAGPLTNLTDGGEGTYGVLRSASYRAQQRAAKLGKTMPAGFVEKRQATMAAKSTSEKLKIKHKKSIAQALIWTDEKRKAHSKRISKLKIGHTVSPETKAKISAALKGRRISEDSRQKRLGLKPSKETRLKISAALKGHIVSTETRSKISNSRTGLVFSEKTKQRMSDSAIARW